MFISMVIQFSYHIQLADPRVHNYCNFSFMQDIRNDTVVLPDNQKKKYLDNLQEPSSSICPSPVPGTANFYPREHMYSVQVKSETDPTPENRDSKILPSCAAVSRVSLFQPQTDRGKRYWHQVPSPGWVDSGPDHGPTAGYRCLVHIHFEDGDGPFPLDATWVVAAVRYEQRRVLHRFERLSSTVANEPEDDRSSGRYGEGDLHVHQKVHGLPPLLSGTRGAEPARHWPGYPGTAWEADCWNETKSKLTLQPGNKRAQHGSHAIPRHQIQRRQTAGEVGCWFG